MGSDFFTFKVFDSHLNFSVPAMINITIYTGVIALGDLGRTTCFEDIDCQIGLYGFAIDDSQGDLSVTMTNITLYGEMIDPFNNTPVDVGSTLGIRSPYPYDSGAILTLRPPAGLFSSPQINSNGSQYPPLDQFFRISYYASITLGNATISSLEVDVQLTVHSVNDESILTCGTDLLQTLAAGVVANDLEFNFSRPDRVYIHDFFITERDRGVDPIRVTIEASHGFVTLNNTLPSTISFDGRCSGTLRWRCRGDAFNRNYMVFVGNPKDVQDALNGMFFISYDPFTMNNVTVTIYDGKDGDCIAEFATWSYRPRCFVSSCTRRVNVSEVWLNDGDWEPVLVLTLWQFFALVFSIVSCFGALLSSISKLLSYILWFICFGWRKHRREALARREAAAALEPRTNSNMFTKSRIAASIPVGRAGEAAAKEPGAVPSTQAGKFRLPGPGLFRRLLGRGAVAATQDIPRYHRGPSEEMNWEDSD